MEKGKIRRIAEFMSPELQEIEELFIKEAEENTDEYLKKYQELPASFGGNYICSDLFKETFYIYSQSPQSRKKYARIIHNSAAVLANEMFQIKVNNPEIKKCIFVSGVPGAGKSFLIQSLLLASEINRDTMIYEGDITTETIYDKLNKVTEKEMEVYIIIVNPTLELAEENVITRTNGAREAIQAISNSDIESYFRNMDSGSRTTAVMGYIQDQLIDKYGSSDGMRMFQNFLATQDTNYITRTNGARDIALRFLTPSDILSYRSR